MNTDHYYEIGHKHKVCEDYATSGVLGELAFGIVSDGCSASTDVDFGCRALAFATKDALLNGMAFAPAKDLGEFIIRRAAKASFGFVSLHPKALDATLLLVLINDQQVRLLMFGVLVVRRPSGYQITHVEYGTPAPFYLSYQLDLGRLEEYKTLCDVPKQITTVSINGGLKDTKITQLPYDAPVELFLPRQEVTMAAVVSDGINTFHEGDDTSMDYLELVDELTTYKSVIGLFQARSSSFFKRACLKQQRTHHDDLSIASVIVQPEFFNNP